MPLLQPKRGNWHTKNFTNKVLSSEKSVQKKCIEIMVIIPFLHKNNSPSLKFFPYTYMSALLLYTGGADMNSHFVTYCSLHGRSASPGVFNHNGFNIIFVINLWERLDRTVVTSFWTWGLYQLGARRALANKKKWQKLKFGRPGAPWFVQKWCHYNRLLIEFLKLCFEEWKKKLLWQRYQIQNCFL